MLLYCLDKVPLRPEEGQSTLTETSARQTRLSHAGIREPNLFLDKVADVAPSDGY